MDVRKLKHDIILHTYWPIQWFEAPHGFAGHVANAFEDKEGKIVLEMAYAPVNVFWWWKDKDGNAPAPETIRTDLRLWKIDYKAQDMKLPLGELLVQGDMEFPRVDDRYAMSKHSHTYYCAFHPEKVDFPTVGPRMGGGYPPFNSIGHLNKKTGEVKEYFAGARKFTQECVFAPRSPTSHEGDGYLIFLQNNFETMSSELAIVDTQDLSQPVALVKLPVRLRPGLHGNWVDDADVDGHPSGVTNGANGTNGMH